MRTWVLVAAAAAAAAGLAGCDSPAAPPTGGAKADGVTVTEVNFAALDAAIKAHKGEVVLVDFWATWCRPCRERFPHLVALNTRYGDRGLACVSVSIDDPGDDVPVLRFLRDQRAQFENFHWKSWREDRAAFRDHFNFAGGIPHMVAFNRSGERVWDSSSQPLSPAGVDELAQNLSSAK